LVKAKITIAKSIEYATKLKGVIFFSKSFDSLKFPAPLTFPSTIKSE